MNDEDKFAGELVPSPDQELALPGQRHAPPALVTEAGKAAAFAYAEFFGATIQNPNTYRAYRQAVDTFLAWCEQQGLALAQVSPMLVSAYIRELSGSIPKKKLHLSALRHFFDQLVVRHAVAFNPALSVRAPRYTNVEGKTPALSIQQANLLLSSVTTEHVVGLRDRAIIAMLVYTAVRVGAVARLQVKDYRYDGTQWTLHFLEKGGKARVIPVRHDLQRYLHEYLEAAGIRLEEKETPFFRPAQNKVRQLKDQPMAEVRILRMLKRRLKDAGLPANVFTCHSIRATVITDLLEQGVALEDVQRLAGHADPRTTRLYDRSQKEVTRNIVERISIAASVASTPR